MLSSSQTPLSKWRLGGSSGPTSGWRQQATTLAGLLCTLNVASSLGEVQPTSGAASEQPATSSQLDGAILMKLPALWPRSQLRASRPINQDAGRRVGPAFTARIWGCRDWTNRASVRCDSWSSQGRTISIRGWRLSALVAPSLGRTQQPARQVASTTTYRAATWGSGAAWLRRRLDIFAPILLHLQRRFTCDLPRLGAR